MDTKCDCSGLACVRFVKFPERMKKPRFKTSNPLPDKSDPLTETDGAIRSIIILTIIS
jgi:hypothetical protein